MHLLSFVAIAILGLMVCIVAPVAIVLIITAFVLLHILHFLFSNALAFGVLALILLGAMLGAEDALPPPADPTHPAVAVLVPGHWTSTGNGQATWSPSTWVIQQVPVEPALFFAPTQQVAIYPQQCGCVYTTCNTLPPITYHWNIERHQQLRRDDCHSR